MDIEEHHIRIIQRQTMESEGSIQNWDVVQLSAPLPSTSLWDWGSNPNPCLNASPVTAQQRSRGRFIQRQFVQVYKKRNPQSSRSTCRDKKNIQFIIPKQFGEQTSIIPLLIERIYKAVLIVSPPVAPIRRSRQRAVPSPSRDTPGARRSQDREQVLRQGAARLARDSTRHL